MRVSASRTALFTGMIGSLSCERSGLLHGLPGMIFVR
jgi:hypothetical protein